MKQVSIYIIGLFLLFATYSCEESSSSDPNTIGGDTDLEFTKVGTKFFLSFNASDFTGGKVSDSEIKDSCAISQNDDGIITVACQFEFTLNALNQLDTLFGTTEIPDDAKEALIKAYLKNFNAVIDDSDTNAMKLSFEAKGRATSEGIQDFLYSDGDMSKPFTLVKYNAKVGDKYEYTLKDGTKIKREVTYRSTEDEWEWDFYLMKVIKVEEKKENDPFVEKITYITNHKYGLLGINAVLKTGEEIKIVII